MEIRFFNMTDTRNTIGKKLTDYTTTFIKAKYQDLNITNPTFLLKFTEYPKYNYIYIPLLKRYYFIDDIVVKTDNTFELYCSCDVLESFKDDILNSKGMITQQTNINNYYNSDYKNEIRKEIDIYKSGVTFDYSVKDTVLVTIGGV